MSQQYQRTACLSCFYHTKSSDEFGTMTGKFRWSQQNEHKNDRLNWEKLMRPKEKGGLGF